MGPDDQGAAKASRWLRWYGFLAALFAVAFFIGLVAWIYDEASYGGQPLRQPFEFVIFGAGFVYIAWRWLIRGRR